MWTTLSNKLLFFVRKMCESFAVQFSTKNKPICDIYSQNFNETLTNDFVNFEQMAQDCLGLDGH